MLLRVAFTTAFLVVAPKAQASEAANLCRGDAFRFCMDELPDRERITACLERRKADLSPGCRTMFDPSKSPAGLSAAGH